MSLSPPGEGPTNAGPGYINVPFRTQYAQGLLFLPDPKDEWTRVQRDYARDRQNKLNNLYRNEVLHDVEILKRPWKPTEDQVPLPAQDRFFNQAFADILINWGQRGVLQELPLEWLEQYAATYINPEAKYSILRRAEDESFLTSPPLKGWKHDVTTLKVLDQLISSNYELDGRVHYLDEEHPDVIRLARVYTLMNRLRLMRRLTDGRNLVVSEAPLPDGSNFRRHNHLLSATWILHRSYVRLLHQRSLYIGTSEVGEKMLERILGISMCYLDIESQNIPYEPILRQQNLESLNSINSLYHELRNALTAIADEALIETRMGLYFEEETVTYNARTRLEEIMNRHLPPALKHWYLWDDILDAAQDFNNYMNTEHVEDKRIDKQVVLIDEKYELLDRLRTQGYYYVPIRVAAPAPQQSDKELELTKRPQKYIRKLAEVNQLRRNLLLLKDWNRKRPWKQLYCPYNTTAGGDYGPDSADETRRGFHEDIKIFSKQLADRHLVYPQQDPSSFNPSNIANIYSSIFPIHPIGSHAIPPGMQQDDWDSGCPICGDKFDLISRKLFAELHCGHFFHYTCLRDYWDLPDNNTFKCPICRQNDWILREEIGVSAEVNDVFDYEQMISAQTGSYVFDQYYHDKEKTLIEKSHLHNAVTGGYPTAYRQDGVEGLTWRYDGDEGFYRRPDTEMAIVREYRRINNRIQKAKFVTDKTGISALDPEDPNPDGVPPPFLPQVDEFNPEGEAIRLAAAEVESARQAVAGNLARTLLDQVYVAQASNGDAGME